MYRRLNSDEFSRVIIIRFDVHTLTVPRTGHYGGIIQEEYIWRWDPNKAMTALSVI
jgi:hypothetical protein